MNAQSNEKGPDQQAETFRQMLAQHMVKNTFYSLLNQLISYLKQC